MPNHLLRHHGVTTALAAASGLAVLGAIWAATAAHQAEHPPTCFGIGWGCTPDPASTAALLGIFVVGPAFVVLVATLLIGLLVASLLEQAAPWARRWSTTVRVLCGAAVTLAWTCAIRELV